MNELERQVMKECNIALTENLDAKDIADFLYSKQYLNEEQMGYIFKNRDTRRNICQIFLLAIVNTCPFKEFVSVLRSGNTYTFLADKLEENALELKISEDSQEGVETKDVEAERRTAETIVKPVNKISVKTAHRKKLAIIAHKLKTLSHDGKMDELKQHTKLILDNFKKEKVKGCFKRPMRQQMGVADLAFTALEAEVIARRVKYDLSLYGCEVFNQMKSLIPFTSNPTASSMTFLARYGSSLTMLESLDVGLQYLDTAKHHAILVEPGQDTGMVYYIEGNLLSQKYEETPTEELKEKVIQTAETAISQFENEAPSIKLDYQRMLMLKMAFCYLGLGLFCRIISDATVSESDLQKAAKLLDFVERPEVWEGMELRRKMLYHVAKAELNRKRQKMELARCHAKEAEKIAEESDWQTELPNICLMLEDIEHAREIHNDTEIDIDAINKLISKLVLSCREETG